MPGNAPVTQYRNEFVLGFAQRASLLKDTTTKEMMIKGNQATFLVANTTGSMVTRGVNGLIQYQDNDNAQVTAVLQERHAPYEMTNFNIFTSQGDQRAIMQMNSMALVNRDIDNFILAELANGTLDTGAAATASMTMIGKAIATLQNGGVPWDGNVYAVISASFLIYLMSLPQFSSADYVNVKPAVNYPGLNATQSNSTGQGWYDWMGVKWIVNSLITGAGSAAEKCYMYHRSAIGYACDTDNVSVEMDYDKKQHSSWTRASLFHGAKMLQNAGIIQMLHDGSAHVAT